MSLIAIDPGTEQSAVVWVESDGYINGSMYPNEHLLTTLRFGVIGEVGASELVIEQIESYGMPVGREIFSTVFWSGRFAEAWQARNGPSWSMLPRKAVKLALCGTVKAKDANIRQALIDRYGGPSCVKKGGPLAGIKSHLWAALALAVTYQDAQKAAG